MATIGGNTQGIATTGASAGASPGGGSGTAIGNKSTSGGATGAGTSIAIGGSAYGGNYTITGGSIGAGGVEASGGYAGSRETAVGGDTGVGGSTAGRVSGVGSATAGGASSVGEGAAGSIAGVGGDTTNGHADSGINTDADADAGGSDAGLACARTDTPQVLTQDLAAGCLGEQYSAQLEASGTGDYAWGASIPAGLDLTLTTDGRLSGLLHNDGEFALDIWVRDQSKGCVSATQRLTLTVNNENMTACPTIKIKGKTSSALAPESCMGWSYEAYFEASGGSPPYAWQTISTPPGLNFDSTSQKGSGSPSASGDWVLQITDATGRVVQRSFATPLRDKCWFAYISSESGAERLHLFDPLLGARLQRPESNATDIAVTDFKFSPDGKFVAYRVKDANDNHALWLWQAPGWDHEQQLDLGGSVTQYAWSNSGQVLAAAISTGTGTLLGGVSVAGVPNKQDKPGIQGLFELQPISAPVDSAITWYGNDGYVAFHSPEDPNYNFDIVSHARYAQGQFEDLFSRTGDTYDRSMVLYPNEAGFFVADPTDAILDFISIASNVGIYHGNVAVAPKAAYVALAANDELNLFRATDTTDPPEVTARATANGCSSILGWAAKQVRIACIDDVSGIVRVHTLDAEHGTAQSAAVRGSETYVNDAWQGYRHFVSPSGAWAALGTGTKLYMANLELAPPSIAWSAGLGNTPTPIDFSFSPDERLLLVNYNTVIRLFVTDSTGLEATLGNIATVPLPCQDDQLSLPNWCGNYSKIAQPVWSPDSQILALVRPDSHLVALDLRALEVGVIDVVPITSSCGDDCIGTGLFQP